MFIRVPDSDNKEKDKNNFEKIFSDTPFTNEDYSYNRYGKFKDSTKRRF